MPLAARFAWLAPAAAAVFAAGCTQSAGADLALRVRPASKVTCVLAFAQFEDGSELTSGFLPRSGRSELRIGLFESRGLSRAFTAGAEGYWAPGGGCDAPLYLNDEAPRQPSAFVSGEVVPLTLELSMPLGFDRDGDGFRSTGHGGGDCDDGRADVSPEAQEVCGDGADNDCSGAADCADPSCAGAGRCEASEATCGDGVDNDGDRLIDCADPDCEGRACSDGNPCTVNDRCAGGICTVAPVICASPPTACHEPSGTCAADGGCVYGVDAGTSCSGGFCGYDGSCGALFRYAPANFTPPPISMFGPAQRFNCGTSTFDSTPSASTPFSNWCGQPPPPVVVAPQGATGIDAVVLPMRGLRVDGSQTLRLIGSRPVILAVFGDVVVDGLINAGGAGTTPGAGGNSSACGATGAGGVGMANSSSGGGGGGGAFGGTGGAGGNSNLSAAGALGGSVNGVTALSPFRGGCGGGAGGDSGGTGGGSGGGVQISASDLMTIRGKVAAQGGGGQGGGSDQSGGGGGGSGGAVLLEATFMSFGPAARVTVNGGSGGEGDNCCASGTYDGANGRDGRNDGVGVVAGGDTSNSPGGAGGAGGAGPTAALDGLNGTTATTGGATLRGGGGGGGGGVGRIRLDFAGDCAKDPGAIFSGAVSSNKGSDGGCP